MRITLDAADGATLTATWSWAPALIAEDAVRDLAQTLVPGAGGAGPPCGAARRGRPHARRDLPLVALSQAEIERLESRYPRIEDILPLSPLQEGLLFHALYDAQAPDVYTVQLELDLEGRARRARRWRRRRRLCSRATPACGRASCTRI